MNEPLTLEGPAVSAYLDGLAAALEALRLNRNFPEWERTRAHLRAMAPREPREGRGRIRVPGDEGPAERAGGRAGPAEGRERVGAPGDEAPAERAGGRAGSAEGRERVEEPGDEGAAERAGSRAAGGSAGASGVEPGALRVDRISALPVPREWVRARVEAELRGEPGLLPAREVRVALRNVHDGIASYAVQVDRLDVVTATVARYSLVVSDRPGRVVSTGELDLQPGAELREKLELLSTQDAALGFAVLQQHGVKVEEVVRGVIGPAVLPGQAGPDVPATRLVLSACLERASIDLEDQRVDDPLAESVTLFAGTRVGLTRARRWAAHPADVPALTAWLRARGSRNLVYGYTA